MLAKNTLLTLVSMLASRGAAFAAMLICSHALGSESYGIVAFVQAASLASGAFLGIGLGAVATAVVAEGRSSGSASTSSEVWALRTVLVLASLAGAAALAAASPWLAERFLGNRERALHVLIGAVLVPATALVHFHSGVLSGSLAFGELARTHLICGLVSIGLVAAGVYWQGALGALLGLTVGAIVTAAVLGKRTAEDGTAHSSRGALRNCWLRRGFLLRRGFPAILLFGLAAPVDWWGFACLTHTSGGLAELGVYAAANLAAAQMRFLPAAFGTVLMARLAGHAGGGELGRAGYDLRVSLLATGVGAVLAAAAIYLAAPRLIVWLGVADAARGTVLVALGVAGAAVAVQLVAERALVALGRVRAAVAVSLVRAVLFAWLAPAAVSGGADGLAVTRAAVCVLHAVGAAAAALYATRATSRSGLEVHDGGRISERVQAA